MTPLATARGIVLSLAAHVAAGALLLTVSAPDWTRPLFVDLVERGESIGGQPGTPGVSSGPAGAAHHAAPAPPREASPPARTAHVWSSRRQAARSAPTATSTPDPTARVKPTPRVEPPPDPRPAPMADPAPAPQPAPEVPPGSAPPPATSSTTPSRSTTSSSPDEPVPTSPSLAPGPSPGEGAGGGARGRGEVRGDAGSSTGGPPGAALASGTGGRAIPPEYGPYLQRFRRHVQESLVYPLAARRQSLRGTVELDVTLDPSGRVRDVHVARSSSHGVLDDAALDTVRRLDPLPLPESLPRRPLLIRLPLVFDLR